MGFIAGTKILGLSGAAAAVNVIRVSAMPALRIAKRKANFHLYAFCEAEGGADRLFGEIEKIAADHGRRISLVSARRVRNYSSSEIEVVIDFKTH